MPLTPEQRIRRELTATQRNVEKLEARIRELEAGHLRHTRRLIVGDGKPYNGYLLFWTNAKTPMSRMPGIKYVAALPNETTDAGYLQFIDDAGTATTLAIDESLYALLAGRSGGQVQIGGTGSGDDYQAYSTSHATKGKVILHSGSTFFVDEQNSIFDTAAYQIKVGATTKLFIYSGEVANGASGPVNVANVINQLHPFFGSALTISDITFHYALTGTAFIDHNKFYEVDPRDGSTRTTIDEDLTNLTSGTSHSASGLPLTLTNPGLIRYDIQLDDNSGGGTATLYCVALTFTLT